MGVNVSTTHFSKNNILNEYLLEETKQMELLHGIINKNKACTIYDMEELKTIPANIYTMQNLKKHNALHIAVTNRMDADIIKYIINKNIKTATQMGEDGDLPIHTALSIGCSNAIIQLLVDAYPDSIKIANYYGILPIHAAIMYNNDTNVVLTLIQAYPDGLYAIDKMGCTPFRYALFLGSNMEIITAIIKTAPKSIHKADIIEFIECKDTNKEIHDIYKYSKEWNERITKNELCLIVYLYIKLRKNNILQEEHITHKYLYVRIILSIIIMYTHIVIDMMKGQSIIRENMEDEQLIERISTVINGLAKEEINDKIRLGLLHINDI
jgi:ankyrin repeat protein